MTQIGECVMAKFIDREVLVAELRRQVKDRKIEDDTKPWAVGFINLANSLDNSSWLAPTHKE